MERDPAPIAILLGWLEVGRAAMVWHGYRAAGPALRRAVSLVARPQSILLWLFLALPGIALLVGVSSLPPVSDAISLSTILTTMLLGQVYGFLGAWLKVIRLAAACGIVASRTRSPLTPRG